MSWVAGMDRLYSVLDPDFLRKLEQGCYSHVAAVWDRYEFEHCRKLTSWKRRTGFLVSEYKISTFSECHKFFQKISWFTDIPISSLKIKKKSNFQNFVIFNFFRLEQSQE